MLRSVGIGEAARLLLLSVDKSAHTILWWVPFNLWAVLVWHGPNLVYRLDAWPIS